MVQEILSHGGDVLKFSGDAFLVIFKETLNISIQDAVHVAIDTAVNIQKNFGQYETDVGVILKVKIAISSGEVYFSLIGTETNSHYVVVGQPIWDVKFGERLCVAGSVVVSLAGLYYLFRHTIGDISIFEILFNSLAVCNSHRICLATNAR